MMKKCKKGRLRNLAKKKTDANDERKTKKLKPETEKRQIKNILERLATNVLLFCVFQFFSTKNVDNEDFNQYLQWAAS